MAITTGTLIEAGWHILKRHWLLLALAGLLAGAVQAGQRMLDGYGTNQSLTQALSMILLAMVLAAGLQYVIYAIVTRKVLLGEGLAHPGVTARYGHFALVHLLIFLAVLPGLVLLIVPGVLLLLRWFIAPVFTLARGMNTMEALSASRDATRGHRGAMLGALLALIAIWLVPYVLLTIFAGGFLAVSTTPIFGAVGLARLALSGLAGSLSLAFGIGVFRELAHDQDPLSEVFA
jgi:hypothetical protein